MLHTTKYGIKQKLNSLKKSELFEELIKDEQLLFADILKNKYH